MLIHWIWLATRPNLSEKDKLMLLSHFGDPEDIYYADSQAFQGVEGLTVKGAEALQNKDLQEAGKILRQCAQKNIQICTYHDGIYPGKLKNIPDPPMVLYYKGRLPELDSYPVIAVVGTRKASPYGMSVSRKMGDQIARCGAVVVSGLAEGIDGAASAGALSADGITVGVLGCGADVVYPACNRSLFADMERYGCILSEFPPETPPHKWNFPRRNRIISGISNGVLVVEAPERSGALITARRAADQGRDVFVVPGNVDVPTCYGSNALLREGAIPVRNGWDVVSEYQALYPEQIRHYHMSAEPLATDEVMNTAVVAEKTLSKVAQKPRRVKKNSSADKKNEKITIDNEDQPTYSDIRDIMADLTEAEKTVVRVLQNGQCLVDDLIDRSGMPASDVLPILTLLELQQIIVRRPGKYVALK